MSEIHTTDSLTSGETLRVFVPILGAAYAAGVLTYVLAVSLGPEVNDWSGVLLAVAGIGTFLAAALCARFSIPTPAQFVVGMVPLALLFTWRGLGLLLEVEFADEPHPVLLALVVLIALFAGQAAAVFGYEVGSRIG